MLHHILVGVDGSPLAETILSYVTALAKNTGADVTLIHVVHVSEEMRKNEAYRFLQPSLEQAKTNAHDYLHRLARQLSDAGVKTHNRVLVGAAAAEIVHCAEQEGMDLIALATHGRSGLQRWFYGSVAEKVLHTTRTPLLLIRPAEELATAPRTLSQIIVPLDGSPLAEVALPLAETISARCHVPLVLLRVVEIETIAFSDPTGMVGANYQALLDGLQQDADSYVAQLASSIRSKGVTVQTATPIGLPAEKIVEYTHAHPSSLVVMATHGRTGLAEVVLGSVARRVVLHGDTPTLIVHPSTRQ
jgi:nucleotide-binding universal stress UspA family protein